MQALEVGVDRKDGNIHRFGEDEFLLIMECVMAELQCPIGEFVSFRRRYLNQLFSPAALICELAVPPIH